MWHFQKHMALRFGIFKNTYISEKAFIKSRVRRFEAAANWNQNALRGVLIPIPLLLVA